MAVHFIRTIIVYLFVVLALRIMGKRQVGQLQPSELVVTIMISELAAVPIQDSSSSLLVSFLAIGILLIGEVTLSFISMKSGAARRFLYGSPSVMIEKGKINEKEMKKQRFNINDLMEEIRNKSIPAITEVEYLIIETNGQVSIIPKAAKKPATPEDLNIQVNEVSLSYVIIDDGKIVPQNLKMLGFDAKWLNKQLDNQKIKNPKDVFYMSADRDGEIYVCKKQRNSEE